MEKEVVLRIEHLSKILGNRKILHDISFEAYAGEVFGFLGPNGAGKTTTIKLIAGLLLPEEGEITVCGYDLRCEFEKALEGVGAIVENPEFYSYMSGLENLRQYAAMRDGVTELRIREVVHLVGLENRIRDKVAKYSLGMRQRLGVAQALMHHPKLLILDEPTNGLDPAGIKALRDILKHLAHEEGVAVMVSSHLMSEMELMCDRVGVISEGRLQSVQPIEALVAATAPEYAEFVLGVDNAERAEALLQTLMDVQASRGEDGALCVTVPSGRSDSLMAVVNRTLILNGISVSTVSKKENRRLEDVFIEMTHKGGDQIE
ncbi:MAG: ABC transporter ATP-binding protein [Clostridia bacterium]|nr:ABC transporter ATP-binding protein [Clostridia bacterium]